MPQTRIQNSLKSDLLEDLVPKYKVVLLNDDYTPMDFVVMILQTIFHKSFEDAMGIMLKVHHEGAGICGIFPKDVAQTKAELVRQQAQSHEHPLRCVVEKE